MALVVQKYGGSSVADVAALGQVARQVVARRRAGDRVVVVVSAMGKTTDRLLGMAREVAEEPPQREIDMLVTAGERISMALLSMAIHAAGEDAVSFTGSQSGIITEDSHGGARILDVRPIRLAEALEHDRIVIVAGYQGVSTKKEVTTLGRGGSDTTAVALAAALGADACEIYSDVDGVYTADPRVCPRAQHIDDLPYATMHAMAEAGAKVLNTEAVALAQRAEVMIYARKTGDASGKQTRVHAAAEPAADGRFAAVVGAQDATWLRGRVVEPGAVLEELTGLGFCPLGSGASPSFPSSGPEWSAVVRRTDLQSREALDALVARHRLLAQPVAAVTLIDPGAGVGSGVGERSEPPSVTECSVDDAELADQVSALSWWRTEAGLVVAIEADRCDEVVCRWHDALCLGP